MGAGVLPRVPAANIHSEASNLAGATCVLVSASEVCCSWLKIGVPTQPPSMAGIDIGPDIWQVQGLKRVCGVGLVARGQRSAHLHVQVHHDGCQDFRLKDDHKEYPWVYFDDVHKCWACKPLLRVVVQVTYGQ